MRQLVKIPNPLLRKKSAPVKTIDGEVKELAKDMIAYMHLRGTLIPVGLSAVQLGVLLRVIAFKANPDSSDLKDIQVLINPELTRLKGNHIVYEGCLSLPGRTFAVKRSKIAKIQGLTLNGEIRTFRGRDLLAQVFQHEVDHLNGILIDAVGKEVAR
jgi:peptide deformylase